jgi:hypothetical protein
LTPWTGDQSIVRSLPASRTKQTQKKRTQTFMLEVGSEPTIAVLEQAKTIHALGCAATVNGSREHTYIKLNIMYKIFCNARNIRFLRFLFKSVALLGVNYEIFLVWPLMTISSSSNAVSMSIQQNVLYIIKYIS